MSQVTVSPQRTVAQRCRLSSRKYGVTTRIVPSKQSQWISQNTRCAIVRAEKEQASEAPTKVEDEEELPPWIKREKERELQAQQPSGGFPWPLYLLFSLFTAIASVGSFFEYANKNPVFGVIEPDSPLWAPILGVFALTGIPTTVFLFYKGVEGANKAAELQDRLDGYMD